MGAFLFWVNKVNDSQIKGLFENDSMWSHLEELRKRLLISVLVVAVFSVIAYFFSDQILNFILKPLSNLSHKAYFISPYDAFVVKLQVAFWAALFLAAPLLLTQIWLFVAPGLYHREKKLFLLLALSSVVLFVAGLSAAFFIVIPATMEFFLSFGTSTLEPLISIEKYFSFIVWMGLSFSLAFQTPIFLVGLVKLGIVELETLKSVRRSVVVVVFIISAVITPSPDPFSQCLLALPLWLLYEASLLIASFPRRAKPIFRKVDN